MGGGGGAGSTDGGTGTPNLGFASSGTAGGGIVILTIGGFTGTGTINANGNAPNTTLQNDGAGGGGAGGSVLVTTGGTLTGLTVHADGGNGASNTGGASPQPHGPGGGGGGGVIYSTMALNASSTSNGGAAGTTAGGVNYNATTGADGLVQVIAATTTPVFPVNCSVLAANFISASISSENNNNMLRWTVADDEKVQQYNIERSVGGIDFVSIATVLPQSTGNNNKPYQYTDADVRINESLLQYRIKLIQIDGHIIYSKTIQVKNSLQVTGPSLTPNPVVNYANLYFLANNLAAISVQVVDLKGKPVWEKQYTARLGMNMLPLNNLQSLSDGVYIVHISNGSQVQTVKMFVRH
jgi:hypothetical protein